MYTTILTLYRSGMKIRKISRTTSIHRDTVRKIIKRYEKELLEYIDVNDKSIFDDIRVSKVLNDDTVEKIKNIVNEFHSKFKKSE